MNGWREIGTVPVNRFVLMASLSGYIGIEWHYETAKYIPSYIQAPYRDVGNDSLGDAGFKPTHWMPLPKPPTLKKRKEQDGNTKHEGH